MPTAQYSTIEEADANNKEGTPNSSSPSSSNEDVAAVNSSTQRTKKRSKRQRSIGSNNNDSDDDEEYFSSTNSSSVVVSTTAVTKSHDDDDAAVDLEEDEEQLIIGTSLVPLLDMNNDDENNNNDSNKNCEGAGRCWSCFIHLNNNNNSSNNDDEGGKNLNNRRQNNNSNSYYTTYEHPLLSIPLCSICHDRAEAVEGGVIDAQLRRSDGAHDGTTAANNNNNFGSSNVGGGNAATAIVTMNDSHPEEEGEVNACSWCGLTTTESSSSETSSHSSSSIHSPSTKLHRTMTIIGGLQQQIQSSTIYLDDIPLGDGGTNELLLCDHCPRGICVKCCTVGLGGHVDALKQVRRICNGDEEEEEWKCCYCHPTEFLERLRMEYRLVCGERDGDSTVKQQRKMDEDDDVMDVDEDDPMKDANNYNVEDNDAQIARLIDELTAAEDALSMAQQMLSKAEIEQTRHEIESELLLSNHHPSSTSTTLGLEDLSEAVEEELADYLQKWQRKFDLHSDTVIRLQEELEEGGVVQLAQFYKFREDEGRRAREQLGGGGGGGDEGGDDSEYAKRAEMELGEFLVFE